MGFFHSLFGKRGRDDQGLHQVGLRLQQPPTPQHAAGHAQNAVNAAREVDGIELDYTPDTLGDVDRIIGQFHAEGLRADQIGETVFSFGCYVGEVMVRNDHGIWTMPGDTNLPEELKADNTMMVIEFPNGDVCDPIGKAFKLLEFGAGESLAYFYHVFTKKG